MAEPFWTRHRGPFRLVLTRPGKKAETHTLKWVQACCESGQDAEDEARALLADPRDTIVNVHVWSETEQQFVCGYRK
jgi:hypothetical protein